MLTRKALDELKRILKTDYGREDLSDEEAEELGVSLLRLTRTSLEALGREKEVKKD
jgi:hypothetical protein